jgi:glutathione S-transferase
MKLYYAPDTCSLSPHIVLRELELEFELVKVNNSSKITADGRDFRAINPKGYVAALELDDGQILTEGPAIVQYLADLKPEHGLAPRAGSWERCVCRNGLTLSPVKYTLARHRCSTRAARRGQSDFS